MLILSRKTGESFLIGNDIEITVLDIQSDKIRIGIDAPSDVLVLRKEVKEIKEENRIASCTVTKEKLKCLNNYLNQSIN